LVNLLFGGKDIFLAQLINCSGEPSYGSHPTFSGLRQCAHGVLSDLERRGTFNCPFNDFLPLITLQDRLTP
jgi:hypothetical protein